MASALPHMKAAKLRPLAVTTAQRSSFFPEVPTMNEAGVKGYEFSTWYGLLMPVRTPKTIVDRVNAEAKKALASAPVKEQFAAQGLEPAASTPEAFGAYLRSEVEKWVGGRQGLRCNARIRPDSAKRLAALLQTSRSSDAEC